MILFGCYFFFSSSMWWTKKWILASVVTHLLYYFKLLPVNWFLLMLAILRKNMTCCWGCCLRKGHTRNSIAIDILLMGLLFIFHQNRWSLLLSFYYSLTNIFWIHFLTLISLCYPFILVGRNSKTCSWSEICWEGLESEETYNTYPTIFRASNWGLANRRWLWSGWRRHCDWTCGHRDLSSAPKFCNS